ncbi:unnamed protein product [Prorocentrum cordatum]|uniref:Uncharacterized protein n=1 Tax=Prorocentrum cordatum TaxID=2364126 RepID=A0ABN9R9F9_9DINO|nr:unnamed protein product [Polarella glacialis]
MPPPPPAQPSTEQTARCTSAARSLGAPGKGYPRRLLHALARAAPRRGDSWTQKRGAAIWTRHGRIPSTVRATVPPTPDLNLRAFSIPPKGLSGSARSPRRARLRARRAPTPHTRGKQALSSSPGSSLGCCSQSLSVLFAAPGSFLASPPTSM